MEIEIYSSLTAQTASDSNESTISSYSCTNKENIPQITWQSYQSLARSAWTFHINHPTEWTVYQQQSVDHPERNKSDAVHHRQEREREQSENLYFISTLSQAPGVSVACDCIHSALRAVHPTTWPWGTWMDSKCFAVKATAMFVNCSRRIITKNGGDTLTDHKDGMGQTFELCSIMHSPSANHHHDAIWPDNKYKSCDVMRIPRCCKLQ